MAFRDVTQELGRQTLTLLTRTCGGNSADLGTVRTGGSNPYTPVVNHSALGKHFSFLSLRVLTFQWGQGWYPRSTSGGKRCNDTREIFCKVPSIDQEMPNDCQER